MTLKVCDKCHKEITNEHISKATVETVVLYNGDQEYPHNREVVQTFKMELCDECAANAVEHMTGVKASPQKLTLEKDIELVKLGLVSRREFEAEKD